MLSETYFITSQAPKNPNKPEGAGITRMLK